MSIIIICNWNIQEKEREKVELECIIYSALNARFILFMKDLCQELQFIGEQSKMKLKKSLSNKKQLKIYDERLASSESQ